MLTTPDEANAELCDISRWINENLSGIELPSDERSMVVAGCLDQALEIQAAIATLYRLQLFGSMMALMRALTESLIRGLWFKSCANDAQLAKYKQGDPKRATSRMVEDIEVALGGNALLSTLMGKTWSAYNDFTHTGYQQVVRRHRAGQIRANYPDDELIHSQRVASALGLLAASSLASMTGRLDLPTAVLERVARFMAR